MPSRRLINKWAAGISDTLALGLLTEGIGLGLPLAALPFLNAAQEAHPAFGRSVKELRDAGVKVLLGSEGYEPHVPHQGSKYLARYPWHVVLAAVETGEGSVSNGSTSATPVRSIVMSWSHLISDDDFKLSRLGAVFGRRSVGEGN